MILYVSVSESYLTLPSLAEPINPPLSSALQFNGFIVASFVISSPELEYHPSNTNPFAAVAVAPAGVLFPLTTSLVMFTEPPE